MAHNIPSIATPVEKIKKSGLVDQAIPAFVFGLGGYEFSYQWLEYTFKQSVVVGLMTMGAVMFLERKYDVGLGLFDSK